MSYILFSTALNRPLARIDADHETATAGEGELLIPCTLNADPDDVEHWRAEAAKPPVEPTPEELLAKAKATKLTEIMAGSNAMESAVKSRYSKLEIDSWGVQQSQAETVLAGGTLPEGALLAALASANGVELADFAVRVLQNVAQAEAVTKAVVSQQQAYELMLKSCTTVEEVQAITVNYTLTEATA